MRSEALKQAVVLVGFLAIISSSSAARAADPDWKAVEQALGKSGQMQPGDVFRVGMPRTDLSVTVKGVPIKAGFALGSYAAFKQLHNHGLMDTPRLFYMHFWANDDPAKLAQGPKAALDQTNSKK